MYKTQNIHWKLFPSHWCPTTPCPFSLVVISFLFVFPETLYFLQSFCVSHANLFPPSLPPFLIHSHLSFFPPFLSFLPSKWTHTVLLNALLFFLNKISTKFKSTVKFRLFLCSPALYALSPLSLKSCWRHTKKYNYSFIYQV